MSKDLFFKHLSEQHLALTYDDVRLKTGYSETPPMDVSLQSKFSRNVSLNIPIVSAAMDTVTEWEMAVEMAKLGGLGIIHRGLSPEVQADQVKKVKYFLNGLIEEPIALYVDEAINQIQALRKKHGWSFHSFPVLDDSNRLVGVLTSNDFELNSDESLTAGEVMTKNPITASSDTNLIQAYDIMSENKVKILPLISRSGNVAGMYVFSDVARIIRGSSSDFNLDEAGHLRVGAAVGTGADTIDRLKLLAPLVDVVVIDTAHGDSKAVYEMLKTIKKHYPKLDVVVGNVSEGDSAKRLVDAGADGIKVGQGPGSICTTRVIAGIGAPQVSAIYSCRQAIGESDVPICADGGITQSGDIPIAIAAGASSVMLGRMFAGTKESPGQIIMHKGAQVKVYRGMGSLGAMIDSSGARERYNQIDSAQEKLVPEGVEGIVPFKGLVSDIMIQYIGGLRAGMGYTGAASIDELWQKGDFHRITPSGIRESHPHDIVVTSDAPNYAK